MRYRKSVRIGKGARVNFSKSGMSLTLGGKGASINLGSRGAFLNTSIPGTGLYDRQKISGISSGNGSHYNGSTGRGENYSGGSAGRGENYSDGGAGGNGEYYFSPNKTLLDIKVKYNDDGTIEILDSEGNPVTDSTLLRKIKQSDDYKRQIQKMSEDILKEYSDIDDSYTEIWKQSIRVMPRKYYENELENYDRLHPLYMARQYGMPMPTPESIFPELQNLAEQSAENALPWRKKKLIKKFIEENQQSFLNNKMIKWQNEKHAFDMAEYNKVRASVNAANMNKKYLNRSLNNDNDFVRATIENWLKTVTFPFEFSVDYEFEAEELKVDLDLPEIEDMPHKKARQMANGTVKLKDKSMKETREDYFRCVLGLGLFLSTYLFGIALGVEKMTVSAYTQRPDNRGVINDDYIYSVRINRDDIAEKDISNMNLSEAFFSFENVCQVNADKTFRTIKPF